MTTENAAKSTKPGARAVVAEPVEASRGHRCMCQIHISPVTELWLLSLWKQAEGNVMLGHNQCQCPCSWSLRSFYTLRVRAEGFRRLPLMPLFSPGSIFGLAFRDKKQCRSYRTLHDKAVWQVGVFWCGWHLHHFGAVLFSDPGRWCCLYSSCHPNIRVCTCSLSYNWFFW